MTTRSFPPPAAPLLEAHLLGSIDFATALALQQRLVYEAGDSTADKISLLVCEHPPIITIGRGGSRAQVLASSGELESRQIEVRWVGRGGGALLHAPGQLAIYPIVPLEVLRWTVGDYLRRLQHGLVAMLADVGLASPVAADETGIRGRTGLLVAMGAAVRGWTTYHGAYVNVAPAMNLQRLVEADITRRRPMSSLVIERQGAVKMTAVRAALVERLAAAFGAARHHLYTGHPLVDEVVRRVHGSDRRAV